MKNAILTITFLLFTLVSKSGNYSTYETGYLVTYSSTIETIKDVLVNNPDFGYVFDPNHNDPNTLPSIIIDHFTLVHDVKRWFDTRGYTDFYKDKKDDSPYDLGQNDGYEAVFAEWMLGFLTIELTN